MSDQSDNRPVVYLVHGVDTELADGEPYWYGNVRSVLHPFFICVPLRYTEYDKGGKGRVATLGGGWAIALAVVGASLLIGWSGMPVIGTTGVILTAAGGAALSVRELVRRNKTASNVGKACSSAHETSAKLSHVIAHSFGTYVFKKVLDSAEIRLKHVILVGSALSRKTNWARLWNLRHDVAKPFVSIRNEYSPKDHVAGWAGYAWPLTGCGSAGKHGFTPTGEGVAYHDVPNAYGPCGTATSQCQEGPVVHNVRLDPFTHSDVFLSGDHAKRLWLPVLFDIPPAEYGEFRDDCMRVLEKIDDSVLLANRADIFAAKQRSFLGTTAAPVALRDYVRERLPNLGIRSNPTQFQQYVRGVCVTTAQFFMTAWQATGQSAARAHLMPEHAVKAAMKRALGQTIRP